MTPEELKNIAIESTKEEVQSILKEMEKAARAGSFSSNFPKITDAAIVQLRSAGFSVEHKVNQIRKTTFYTVSFSK